MSTFIKTGYWEKAEKGFKNWLNLDDFVSSEVLPIRWGTLEGDISDQQDLSQVLAEKEDKIQAQPANFVLAGPVVGDDAIPTFRALTTADVPGIDTDTILFVSVKDFGAVGSGLVNDQPAIQAAVDFAIANSIKQVFFPVGNYRIDSPIIVYKLSSGAYTTFNLDLVGAVNANAGLTNQCSRITCNFNNAFGIGYQNARSGTIKNLLIVGQYSTPSNKTVKQVFEQDISQWTSVCRDETNSPHAGIVIDPFGTTLPVDGGYPGLSSYYKASAAGSSGVTVRDCYITNFVVDFLVSAFNTANAESINIYNTRLYISKIAAAYGQPQTRGCAMNGCAIFLCFNAIDTVTYGQQIGSAPYIDGLLVSTVKNIINIDCVRGHGAFYRIEAEAFWKIGIIAGGASMTDCIFKLQYGNSATDFSKAPDTLVGGFGGISFSRCEFNKAGDTNWNASFAGSSCSFDGCSFDTQQVPYYTAQGNASISFKNSSVGGLVLSEGYDRKFLVSSNPGIYAHHGGTIERQNGVIHRLRNTISGVFITGLNVTIDPGGASTATFVLSDTSKIRVGDQIYSTSAPITFYYLTRNGLNSDTSTQNINPFLGTVSSIVGITVTIKDIPFNMVSGTYNFIFQSYPKYFGSIIGTLTSGSNIITNVYQENSGIDYTGMRLRLSDSAAGIPAGTYVVSENKGARTMTLSSNVTSNIPSAFIYTVFFEKENRITGLPVNATGRYFEIGDVVNENFSATKHICTSTGIAGNATHVPTFSTITTS